MAQDFYAAFHLNGTDDRRISTSDIDGVALAAIQGVNQKLEEALKRRDAENAELRRELADLQTTPDLIRSKNECRCTVTAHESLDYGPLRPRK